jgi:zinc transporter ZupT
LVRPASWTVGMVVLAGLGSVSPQVAAAESYGEPAPGPSDAGVEKDDADEVVVREWYGRPMVIADALSLTAFFGGVLLGSSEYSDLTDGLADGLALVGLAGYLVGGPIVHFSEGRVDIGGASLGLRLGAPLVGAGVGFFAGAVAWSDCDEGNMCVLEGVAIGVLLGFVGGLLVATVVDDAALARKPVTAARRALWVAPTYHPEQRRTGLSLCGTW